MNSLRHTKRFSLPAGDYRPQIVVLTCSPCWQRLRKAVLQLGPAGSVSLPDIIPLPSLYQDSSRQELVYHLSKTATTCCPQILANSYKSTVLSGVIAITIPSTEMGDCVDTSKMHFGLLLFAVFTGGRMINVPYRHSNLHFYTQFN